MILVARTLAVLAAVVSLGPWFGLIDLLVVLQLDDPGFRADFLLNAGWGVLYGVLVPVTLVLIAVRPGWRVLLAQLGVVAVAILMAAVATGDRGELVVALVVAAVTATLGFLTPASAPPTPARIDPLLLVLALVGCVGAIVLAVPMIGATGDPADDVTNGLTHLPIQAAAVLAIAGTAAVSAIAAQRSLPGWRASALSPAVCAAWLGGVSVTHPDLLGSLGRAGGLAALVWGTALAGRVLTAASPAVTDERDLRDLAGSVGDRDQ